MNKKFISLCPYVVLMVTTPDVFADEKKVTKNKSPVYKATEYIKSGSAEEKEWIAAIAESWPSNMNKNIANIKNAKLPDFNINYDSKLFGSKSNPPDLSAPNLGLNTKTYEEESIEIGQKQKILHYHTTSIGTNSATHSSEASALGADAKANTDRSLALGSNSIAQRKYNENLRNKIKQHLPKEKKEAIVREASFGHNGEGEYKTMQLSQISHIAPGTEDTDAVNVHQMQQTIDKKLNDRIGKVDDLEKNTIQVEEHNIRARGSADKTEASQIQTVQHEQAALTAKTNTEKHENNAQTALKETENHRDKANVLVREIQHEASIIGSKVSQDVDTGVIHVGKSLDGKTV